MDDVELALRNLVSPECADIKNVFGDVLAKRLKQEYSDCFIFRLLALNQMQELFQLNRDCTAYLRELGPDEARRKCRNELMGDAKRPLREFNQRCGAFWSEMAAVRVLAEDGFHSFRAVPTQKSKQTSDYQALQNQIPAFIHRG